MKDELFLNNKVVTGLINSIESNGADLIFDETPLTIQSKAIGTDCMMKLANDSSTMIDLTKDYRTFVCNALVPSMRGIQRNINDGAVNVSTSVSSRNSKVTKKGASGNKAGFNAKNVASELDKEFALLCDDDDQNDAAAIEAINNELKAFITVETIDGTEYIVYDQEKIKDCLTYLDKNGLAYKLLRHVDKKIDARIEEGDSVPNKIYKMGLGGDVKYTVLEVEKSGAGVNLLLTCDNDWLPGNEIDERVIAYAATEESAYNYFTTDGEYDWDKIEEWYQMDAIHEKSIEYDVLAYEMQNMSDDEIAQLLNLAEYKVDPYGYGYDVSKKLPYLTDRHIIQMEALRAAGYTGLAFDNLYTRAVMIKGIEESMIGAGGGNNHFVEISVIEDDFGRNIYTGNVTCTSNSPYAYDAIFTNMKSRTVVVYPYGNSEEITSNLYEESIGTAYGMATTLTDETGSFIFDQTASYVFGKVGLDVAFTAGSEIVALKEAYESGVDAQGIEGMLNYCKSVDCMMISGVTVHIAGSDADSAYVYNPSYNDNLLVFSLAAYNESNGTSYTIEEMKSEFLNNSDVFESYQTWYTRYGADAVMNLRDEVIEEDGLKPSEIDSMPAEELEKYLAER